MPRVTLVPQSQREQYIHLQSQQLQLFADFNVTDWACMTECLGSRVRTFRRKELILATASNQETLGLILRGTATERTIHHDGTTPLVAVLQAGDIFAESSLDAGSNPLPTEVAAASPVEALLFNASQINNRKARCPAKGLLVENLMRALAAKQQHAKELLHVTAHRTLKDRIFAYLDLLQTQQGTDTVTVAVGRSELAELLSADRSALSRELHRMRTAGLIDFTGNTFTPRPQIPDMTPKRTAARV